MPPEGWVKLYRQAEDSAVFQDPLTWKLWCWVLMRANHKPAWVPVSTGRGVKTIQMGAGAFIFGRLKAAEALGMSEKMIRSRMDKLEEWGNITRKRAGHFSIITVVNWETYQSREGEEGRARASINTNESAQELFNAENGFQNRAGANEPLNHGGSMEYDDPIAEEGQARARLGPGKGQARATDKNDKNDKNDKKKRAPSESAPPWGDLPESLDTPDVINAFGEWVAFRRESRFPVWKPVTWKKNLADMESWGPAGVVEAVNRSIKGAWRSLHEPRGGMGSGPRPKPSMTTFANRKEVTNA